MKIKHSKDEVKEIERRRKNAQEKSAELAVEAITISLNIMAKEATMTGLGINAIEIRQKQPALTALNSPYEDWTVSFQSPTGKTGFFKIKCSTAELHREANLNKEDLEQLLKIFSEQLEVIRFSSAVQIGLKAIGSELNEVFEQKIKEFAQTVSQEKFVQLIRLLAEETSKTMKKDMAIQEGLYHMRKPQDLLPFERKLFGKLPGEDAIQAFEKGLQV